MLGDSSGVEKREHYSSNVPADQQLLKIGTRTTNYLKKYPFCSDTQSLFEHAEGLQAVS